MSVGGSGVVWYDVQQLATLINGSAGLNAATVTTSKPLLNHAQTWNDGAVTFTGWKLNVTNTASAAASLLVDLQVGGASKFNITRAGSVILAGGAGSYLKVPSMTVAQLVAAATAGAGARAFVTDANATMILGLGLAVVGGGVNAVPVYCDGAAWLVG